MAGTGRICFVRKNCGIALRNGQGLEQIGGGHNVDKSSSECFFFPGKKLSKDFCPLKMCGFLSDLSMRSTCQSVSAKALGFMEKNGKKF